MATKQIAFFNEIPVSTLLRIAAEFRHPHGNSARSAVQGLVNERNSPVRVPEGFYVFRDAFNRELAPIGLRLLKAGGNKVALYLKALPSDEKAGRPEGKFASARPNLRHAQLMGDTDD